MNKIQRDIAVIAGVVLIIALLYVVYKSNVLRPTDDIPHDVTYMVQGQAGVALITYTTPDGEATEPEFVTLPWSLPPIRYYEPTMVVLTAHNSMQYGDVECIILLDGKKWISDQVENPGLNASCGGFVP